MRFIKKRKLGKKVN